MGKKIIGVACDYFKANKYRKRLIEKGFAIIYDKPMVNMNVHIFKIEVDESETIKVGKVLKQLEIEKLN